MNAYLIIAYRDPVHSPRTVIYEWHGEGAGEKALQAEDLWNRPRLRELAEVHIRRADSIFDLLVENESIFTRREAVAG